MRRVESLQTIQILPRDISLFLDLLQSRVMKLEHIQAIHFGGSYAVAKRRVRFLKEAGFLSEWERKPMEPSHISITEKTYNLLKSNGSLQKNRPLTWRQLAKRLQVSPVILPHEFDVLSVKA